MNSSELPRFRSYGDYSSENYGVNSLEFTIGNLSVYFSYKTPVAFISARTGLVIRENDWGSTTGKHLNWIDDDKSKRISGDEFEKQLAEQIEQAYN